MFVTTRPLCLLSIFVTVILVSACQAGTAPVASSSTESSTESANLAMKVLYRSTVCGSITKSQWLTTRSAYETAFQAAKHQLASGPPASPAKIDFSQHAVLLISMGQKRTGGYSLALEKQQLQITDDVVIIEVLWQEPKPGMMLTQMLTNPCLFLEIPQGAYRQVLIKDQTQQVRETLVIE